MAFYELEPIIIVIILFLIGCIKGNTNRIDLYFLKKEKRKNKNLHYCLNNLNDNLNELLNNFDVFFNYSLISTSDIESGANYNETNDIFRKMVHRRQVIILMD